jgi:molecular chaperone DnaK
MRTKIDYGIDLGTTNSAIARMENGEPVIKKTDIQSDVLPSCVHFNKKKDCIVGQTAKNVMKNEKLRAQKDFAKDESNSFLEFKRTMGTDHKYFSKNMNQSFTSEELSAEVLKTLKSFILDEQVESIVITVPAKFINPQNEATIKAGKLAGFRHVELLQEPVAASTAFGLNAKTGNVYWLVFDFGGGTFDVALVKTDEGILTVKDTEGDNFLGGKNLDDAIVDQIIIPYLRDNYNIESIIEDETRKEILRNALKWYAEEAKIQMSFKDSHNILSQLGDLQFVDENGNEPEIDINLTQEMLEHVFTPIFQKAIDITKSLLHRNHLKGSDISSLILIGGPTHSPILRRMLREQITENVDTSVDPMTAVAKGAALFASTLSVPDEVLEEKKDKSKIQIELKYEATTVETEIMMSVKILKELSENEIPEKVFADVVRSDKGWSSGKKTISEKATLIDLQLLEGRSNLFDINLFDDFGNALECQPNQLSVLQGISVNEMTTLPYDICIVRHFSGEEKDLIEPVKGLEKNKKIPATGVVNGLKTRSELRPGMKEDIIRIPIYQGEYNSEGSNPKFNHLVNEVVITGEIVSAVLPKGSDVDLTLKIDRSERMTMTVYFPLIEQSEEIPVEIIDTPIPSEEELISELDMAMLQAENLNAQEVINKLESLEEELENKKGSADGRIQINENLKRELFKLEQLEKASQWPKVEKELKDTFFQFEDLLSKIKQHGLTDKVNMNAVEKHAAELRANIEHVIKEKSIKDAKDLINEIGYLDFELRNLVTDNAMDAQHLRYLDQNFQNYHWKDKNKARSLINEGLRQASAGNNSGIRKILYDVYQLMPDSEKPTGTLAR